MSATKALLLLCVISYSMHQVAAINCFECESWGKAECNTEPKKAGDAKDCGDDDQCYSVTGKNADGKKGVVRGCTTKAASEQDVFTAAKGIFEAFTDGKVLERCDANECNTKASGVNLSVGFLSLMGAFVPLIIGKQ